MMTRLLHIFAVIAFASVVGFAQKTSSIKVSSGALFSMTIVHNGQKSEVSGMQFQVADGNAMSEGATNGRLSFFFGASNSKDEKGFSFQGFIPRAEKGTFHLGDDGDGAGFSIRTTVFNDVPLFMAKSGTYEITAVPLKDGFVEGVFNVVCENVKDDGTVDPYTFSGRFKLPRR